MKRLLTAVVGAPLAIVALFKMPPPAFFVLVAVLFGLAAWEYARIVAHWAPAAPWALVVLLVPLVAWAIAPPLAALEVPMALPVMACLLAIGTGLAVLLSSTPVEQGAPAMGLLAFGGLYLGLPVAALTDLQSRAPWLVLLLWAIVWLGDSAAYYVGTAFGRHRLAPVVSPKKSWEGAAASLATAGLVTIAYCYWRQGSLDWVLLVLALVTSVAAQLGDLVESVIKRGAGVKDSGTLLPGHGGFLDRFDALTFAAPIWWLSLDLLGHLPASP